MAVAASAGTAAAMMQRIVCPERDDWRATAESAGFDFHTIDGERYWDERAYYAFTLDEIEREIEAPTARDRRDVPRTGRPRRRRRRVSAPAEDTGSVLAADLGELAPRRRQPLWPARPEFRRPRPGKAAGIQRRHADLDLRGGGVPVDLARTGDRTQHHPEARRPVQFDPRAPDRGLEETRRRASPASRRDDREYRGCRHAGLSRGHRVAGRIDDHADRHRRHRAARRRPVRRSRRPRRSSSRSSSIPGNGCFTMRSARSC